MSAFLEEPTIQTAEQQYDPYSDRLYRAYLAAAIVSAGLSLIVIGMLVWQNFLTRKAANAAQASADALKDIERPWLLLTVLERFGDNIKLPDGTYEVRRGAYFKFKNFGKTPAFIIEVEGQVEIIPHSNSEFLPVYFAPHKYTEDPVSPPDHESGTISILRNRKDSDEEMAQLRSGEAHLVIAGRIIYADTFGGDDSVHTSRFCYRFEFGRNRFVVFGKKEFNQYT